MHKLRRILNWFTRRQAVEVELESELRYHLDAQTELYIQQGMSPAAARRAANIAVGKVESLKEECRDARSGRWVEATLQDIRYGLRILRRNPGFTLAAVSILALGIGANTAMFSVVYGVLLRPLPYQQGGELVVLHQKAAKSKELNVPFSVKEIADYREQSHTLASVVEHHSMSFLLIANDSAERVETAVVSANFFDVLGVKPLYGRTFVAADEQHGAEAVLVLSHKYWKTRHGGDPNIVGRVFQMNNRPHTVIGVLPPIPQYPVESDVFMPTSQCPTRSAEQFKANRQARMMTVFGRLKPNVPLNRAQADLSVVASHLESAYPDAYPKAYGYGIEAAALQDDLTRRGRTTFLILLGASTLVLLIACANVANLMLARLMRLERELAVRAALGASKARLVRQLLTESILLSSLGGVLGLALAPLALKVLVRFAERFTTRASEVHIDGPVLLFTLLISVVTGIVFGVVPALRSGDQFAQGLRAGSGRTTQTLGSRTLRGGLVIAQVAVSFILLIGAGLMVRSLMHLLREDAGFRADRLLSMRISPNFTHYATADPLRVLLRNVLDHAKQTGGVEAAALATNFPFNRNGVASGPGSTDFEIEGNLIEAGQIRPKVDITIVSSDYFDTIRQPLINGRAFNDHDDEKALPVAVINQSMSKHRWPGGHAIGQRITFDHGKTWHRIEGIAGDVKEYGVSTPVTDEVYVPLLQNPFGNLLIVRTAQDPQAVVPLLRAALRDVDPLLAIDQVDTIESLRDESVATPRLTATLLGLFAMLALLISASGIAAVMALSVSQRTRELGIRMALGAARESLLRMIVMQGLGLALAGTVLGVAGALALTRVLSNLLYATSPTDVVTFVAVSATLIVVAGVASLIPARQVTAIDPLIALRQE